MPREPFNVTEFVFKVFSVLGSIAWAAGVTFAGYLLDEVPLVRDHVELLILMFIGTVVAPTIVTLVVRTRRARRNRRAAPTVA